MTNTQAKKKSKPFSSKENYTDPVTGMARLLHPKFVDTFWFIAETIASEVVCIFNPNSDAKIRLNQCKFVAEHSNMYGSEMNLKDDRPPGEKMPYHHQGLLELVIEILTEKKADPKLIKMLESMV